MTVPVDTVEAVRCSWSGGGTIFYIVVCPGVKILYIVNGPGGDRLLCHTGSRPCDA